MKQTLNLSTDRFARLDGAACLRVTQGTLWLTIDGEPDDRVLEPGDRIALAPHSRALVQALGAPARFVVRPAPGRIEAGWQALREALRPLRRALAPQAARLL